MRPSSVAAPSARAGAVGICSRLPAFHRAAPGDGRTPPDRARGAQGARHLCRFSARRSGPVRTGDDVRAVKRRKRRAGASRFLAASGARWRSPVGTTGVAGGLALWGRLPACRFGRHPAARSTVDVRRGGTGNTGQGCPVNRQARMPAPQREPNRVQETEMRPVRGGASRSRWNGQVGTVGRAPQATGQRFPGSSSQ